MDGTDIEALYALGFDFQHRFQNFALGVFGDYVEGFKSGASAVAIGVQASYGWSL